MDEAYELADYLPFSLKTPAEIEYLNFLWDAFEFNYRNGKFQFALLPYHMLVMCFVYFNLWQIRQVRRLDFEMGLIGFRKELEKEMLNATTPLGFSVVNESDILRLLKLIACDNGKIGTYAKLVKDRNEIAHSNGKILYSSQAALDQKLREALRSVREIQTHSTTVIEQAYREFLLHSQDPDEREYIDAVDQIREEFIHRNYLSQKDIEICLRFPVDTLAEEPHYEGICDLHGILQTEFSPE